MIRLAKTPHSIRLLLTNRCNLTCAFCLADASLKSNPDELSTREWLSFMERLKELRIFNVILSGGEIFLREDLFELIKKLRDNRMHRISIFTNGTLISEDVADSLSRLKVKNIAVSVDGLEDNHDQLRGTGSFQKTVKGMRHLITAGIFPQVSFTPIKNNHRDLGSLIDFVTSLGVRAISVNSISPEGRCINIYQEIALDFPDQEKDVLDTVARKQEEYPDIKIDCQLGFYYHLPESYNYYRENPQNFKLKHLTDGCGAAKTSCAITATGDVIPCEGLTDSIGGNIRQRDLMDIWTHSESLKRIRELADIPMTQTSHCKDCKYIHLCDGGCRATAYLIYDDLLAPCSRCPYCKTIADREPEIVKEHRA